LIAWPAAAILQGRMVAGDACSRALGWGLPMEQNEGCAASYLCAYVHSGVMVGTSE